jgi:type VII secretion protein EccB
MQTRSDQAQAYRFTTRRIVNALLSGEPETAERPMRRFGMGIFGSAMVAAIVFAAVGIVGFLFPSGARLADKDIVVERETGATYIFQEGLLFPVRNFTSARLAIGEENPKISRVSVKSLRGIPRGPLIGIPDLPDSLPDAKSLITGVWSVCSRPPETGSLDRETDVVVGGPRPDGIPLGDRALVVRRQVTNEVQYFVVHKGRSMRIADDGIIALDMTEKPKVEVTGGLLNAVPPGPYLQPPDTPGRGDPGAIIDGSPGIIGDIYNGSANGPFYVLTTTGLKRIGATMKKILLGAGANEHDVSLASVTTALAKDDRPFQEPGFPDDVPEVPAGPAPEMVCAVTVPAPPPGDSGIELYVYRSMGDVSKLKQVPGSGTAGTGDVKTAEYVQMIGGEAALVRASSAPGDNTPIVTTYLVAQGYKYPLLDEGVKVALGYGSVRPVPVPTFMLAQLPTGNVLDPRTAGGTEVGGDPAGGDPAGGTGTDVGDDPGGGTGTTG